MIIGNPHPEFTYTFGNDFKYKNINLSIQFTGVQGNEIFNSLRILTEGMVEPFGNRAKAVVNRWTPTNTDTDIPRAAAWDPNNNARVSDRWIEDGSYLRLQSISIGYNFGKSILDKLKFIRSGKIYFTAQNVLTFTNYKGYDPEVGSFNQDALLMGIDNGRYPISRSFTGGIKVTF